MSLLDELEKKAQQQKEAELSAKEKREQQEAHYQTHIVPRMREIYDYLDKVVKHLTYVKPEKTFQYEIPSVGTLHFRPAYDHKLEVDHQRWETVITLNAHVVLEQADAEPVEVEGERNVKKLARFLRDQMLAGNAKSKKDEEGNLISATFRIHGKLLQQVRVKAHVESERIQVELHRFEDFGTGKRYLAHDQINTELLDQLGRYIAGEPNHFLREELPEEVRARLRAEMEKAERQRTQEVMLAESMRRLEDEPAESHDPISGLKEKLGPITKRLRLKDLWNRKNRKED